MVKHQDGKWTEKFYIYLNSTVDEVTFAHIPSYSYDLSNLEVDKMARQELERMYPETIQRKTVQVNQVERKPDIW